MCILISPKMDTFHMVKLPKMDTLYFAGVKPSKVDIADIVKAPKMDTAMARRCRVAAC